jgi:hypothetical protein
MHDCSIVIILIFNIVASDHGRTYLNSQLDVGACRVDIPDPTCNAYGLPTQTLKKLRLVTTLCLFIGMMRNKQLFCMA